MKRFFLIIMALMLFLPSAFATKRALVIGISEYRDTRWMKPRISAERDIVYVKKVLAKTGFQANNIVTLKNKQATKANIVNAFNQLATTSKTGDIIYIHFSGHGQLMTDVNGDENPDLWGNRWDEAWVPYDASYSYDKYDNGQFHLCDDEIGILLSSIKKKVGKSGLILVVVDACHSGDSTRGNDHEDDVYYDTVGDTLSYASPLPVNRGTSSNFVIKNAPSTSKKMKKITENWITVSACQSHQLNSEMHDSQGQRIGMLTYGIFSILNKLPAISNVSFEDYLINFMKQNKHPASVVVQTPVVTGNHKIQKICNTFR